jgi:hypothetical protein
MKIQSRRFLQLSAGAGLFISSIAGFAGEIREGATMHVRPNSIWFQDADKFAHWQRLQKRGDSTALASYQDKVLSNRDAWQFINQLAVRVLRYERRKHRVNVEMKTEGRLLGTKWLLDSDSVLQ